MKRYCCRQKTPTEESIWASVIFLSSDKKCLHTLYPASSVHPFRPSLPSSCLRLNNVVYPPAAPGVMTHHVALTLLFEQALQVINPAVTIPYWEYTIEGESYIVWMTEFPCRNVVITYDNLRGKGIHDKNLPAWKDFYFQ